jgi:hypothetical protein
LTAPSPPCASHGGGSTVSSLHLSPPQHTSCLSSSRFFFVSFPLSHIIFFLDFFFHFFPFFLLFLLHFFFFKATAKASAEVAAERVSFFYFFSLTNDVKK